MIAPAPSGNPIRKRTIDLGEIRGLLDRIVEKWKPLQIWLFGSRARGKATPGSDWDLLVVVPDHVRDVDDPLATWNLKASTKPASDIFLCRVSEFEDGRQTPNTIAFEAAHFGLLIQ
jgi:predicted nucleotidyltransferase